MPTIPTTSATAKTAAADHDALQAALDSLYNSGDFVFSARVPPPGRRFGANNKIARKFTGETVAQVCALKHLGCTMVGIQKILGQMYTPKPAYQTVQNLLDGEVYADLRTGPGFMSRYEHYLNYFAQTFKNYPNWHPSGAVMQQAQSASAGSQYQGSAPASWKAAAPVDTTDHNAKRMADAAAARAKARTACQY